MNIVGQYGEYRLQQLVTTCERIVNQKLLDARDASLLGLLGQFITVESGWGDEFPDYVKAAVNKDYIWPSEGEEYIFVVVDGKCVYRGGWKIPGDVFLVKGVKNNPPILSPMSCSMLFFIKGDDGSLENEEDENSEEE